jgi:predicted patatin/cPLA2 family phospholipase
MGTSQVRALFRLGFGEIAKWIVAVSSGAAVAAYFLAGWEQIQQGCSLLIKGVPNYIHPGILNLGRIIDLDGIEWEQRYGPNKIDVEGIRKSKTEFLVAVMDRKTGQYLIKNAKSDTIKWLKAAMNLKWIARGKVFFGETELCDAGDYQVNLRSTIEQLEKKPTHILILPSNTLEDNPPTNPVLRIYEALTYLRYPLRKAEMVECRFENIQRQIDWCHQNGIEVGILWPEKVLGLWNLTVSSAILQAGCSTAEKNAMEQLENAIGLKEADRI